METKYPWLSGKATGSQYTCPADLTPEEAQIVQEAAKKAHEALGIEVYPGVDVLLTSPESLRLEANTIPGMTETSLLPMGAAAAGHSFGDLCVRITELSLAPGALVKTEYMFFVEPPAERENPANECFI